MSEVQLDEKQEALLSQFKEAVSDVAKKDWDDFYYCRWLNARSWDLGKAEKMLRDDVTWREENDMENILSWKSPDVLPKYFPGGYYGYDKEGYPIWIDHYATIDQKGMMCCSTKRDILRFKVQAVEHLFKNIFPECCKKTGKRISQTVIIFDMEGMGRKHLWRPAINIATELLSTLEAHYPDTLRVAYIINAPKIFPIAWALAKPFLSEYTRSKIQLLSGDWKSHLLKYIDADQLPVHWGGRRMEPDEFCTSKICMGGKIPESYRITNFLDNLDLNDFTSVTIQSRSSLQLDYDIKRAGTCLSWQFRTDGGDIGFGLYKRTADTRQKASEMDEVVRTERCNSHLIPESGQFVCTDPGTYVARFDNTYSWVNLKKVQYLVEITEPDEGTELQKNTTRL